MPIGKIAVDFKIERKASQTSVNDLLDYYQKQYITGEIDIKDYHQIYSYLHKQGAVSAHE
ncbi:hypothetical protein CIL03_14820 [Virgibacillus indicus]|uniref:YppF-like protein n=1 Tax=Virgibacillus indicus TaxID=2024554 RepID=A0A265N7I9_9BACI|nr:YppF family protein [Virgibacillus indicus]OZU87972.1 hypothetical protein CIL03_14820 [Virgibacillus indicus]